MVEWLPLCKRSHGDRVRPKFCTKGGPSIPLHPGARRNVPFGQPRLSGEESGGLKRTLFPFGKAIPPTGSVAGLGER